MAFSPTYFTVAHAKDFVFYDLRELLEKTQKCMIPGNFVVHCTFGSNVTDITNYDKLMFEFGNSVVKVNEKVCILKSIGNIRSIKDPRIEFIALQNESKKERLLLKTIRKCSGGFMDLSSLSLHHLIYLWKNRKFLLTRCNIKFAESEISQFLLSKYKFEIKDRSSSSSARSQTQQKEAPTILC